MVQYSGNNPLIPGEEGPVTLQGGKQASDDTAYIYLVLSKI